MQRMEEPLLHQQNVPVAVQKIQLEEHVNHVVLLPNVPTDAQPPHQQVEIVQPVLTDLINIVK